jgi:hypothetical protein
MLNRSWVEHQPNNKFDARVNKARASKKNILSLMIEQSKLKHQDQEIV